MTGAFSRKVPFTRAASSARAMASQSASARSHLVRTTTPRHCRMDELTERLRQRETPVAARIAHERLLLCLRTLRPEEYDELVRAVAESDR